MIKRRTVISGLAALPFTAGLARATPTANTKKLVSKSGLSLPPIGMGTWLTFNISLGSPELSQRKAVLEAFFDAGGGMIDSSPMYGNSEKIVGHLMKELPEDANLFSATKIWTPIASNGDNQLSQSQRLWNENILDLEQVHNLLRWEPHLKMLREAKAKGTIRYIGLTTSHGRRHDAFEKLMRSEDIDTVQFTYNILDREAEKRLLPTAQDKGLAVIINKPFRTGGLFNRVKGQNLPDWAVSELDCQSWAEYLLKFIISHPAVHCVIPATRRADHMRENMRAGTGKLPDAAMRETMIRHFESL
ncbi:aldo/keto reductase [Hellea sp.]|nr:aldo/keto reductase [Hellea sp.]